MIISNIRSVTTETSDNSITNLEMLLPLETNPVFIVAKCVSCDAKFERQYIEYYQALIVFGSVMIIGGGALYLLHIRSLKKIDLEQLNKHLKML